MLNKHNLNVAQFASKDETRFAMSAILVEEHATVGTNGHYLAWVSEDSTEPARFPIVPGFGPAAGEERKRFLLDRESALQIAKAVPNGKSLPILSHVAVKTETNVENGETQGVLAVTDLERPQVFHPKPTSGQFPNYQAVVPKWEDAKFRIAVNAGYLAQIAKAYAGFVEAHGTSQTVVLSFYGESDAMRFDGQREGQGMTAVLMPIRDTSDQVGTYGYAERQAKREAEAEAAKLAKATAELAEESAA